jgi:hypothetical protein
LRERGPGQQLLQTASSHCIRSKRSTLKLTIEPGTPAVDVINNVGGIVLRDGSEADRGFQEVDEGQYDEPADVFTACGNGMALRTAVGRELGWFDDAFFMYYEDTDLSWRWRSRGWSVRFYVERNRLLMLTKNATGSLASRAIWGYLRGSAGRSSAPFGTRSFNVGVRDYAPTRSMRTSCWPICVMHPKRCVNAE